jgi:hypothetical protein
MSCRRAAGAVGAGPGLLIDVTGCRGNSNALLPMTTVAGVPPFHSGGTHTSPWRIRQMCPDLLIVDRCSGHLPNTYLFTIRAHDIVCTARCSRLSVRSAAFLAEVKAVVTPLIMSANDPYWDILPPPHALSVCLKLMSFPCEEVSHNLILAHRLLAQDVDTAVTGETATLRGGRTAPSPCPQAWRPREAPDHPRCGSRCDACRPG